MAKFYSSLTEIKNGLQSGTLTVEGLVKDHLSQIKLNAHLNVFNEVFESEAIIRAKSC
jgi:aspartyl-tRNA(Asn)/glutamyl-tRNA(Gln) amidotransferase subunit A